MTRTDSATTERMALMDPGRIRTVSVKALGNLRLLTISIDSYLPFLLRFPLLRKNLEQLVVERTSIQRRRYRRYIVKGQAKFRAESGEVAGEVVHLGKGGVLLRSNVILPKGTNLSIHFTVQGYPEAFEAEGWW